MDLKDKFAAKMITYEENINCIVDVCSNVILCSKKSIC